MSLLESNKGACVYCRPPSGGRRAQQSAQDDNDSNASISETEGASKRSRSHRGVAASQSAASAGQGATSARHAGAASVSGATLLGQLQDLAQPEDDLVLPLEVQMDPEPSQPRAAEAEAAEPALHSTQAPTVPTGQRTTRLQHQQAQTQPMQPVTAQVAHDGDQGGQHAAMLTGLQPDGPGARDDTVASGVSNMPSLPDGSRQQQQQQPARWRRLRQRGPSSDNGSLHAAAGSEPGSGIVLGDRASMLATAPASAGNRGAPLSQQQLDLSLSAGPSALLSHNESGMQQRSSVMAPVTESNQSIAADIRNCTDEDLGCAHKSTMFSFTVSCAMPSLQIPASAFDSLNLPHIQCNPLCMMGSTYQSVMHCCTSQAVLTLLMCC